MNSAEHEKTEGNNGSLEYDIQALTGAAEYFENMATGANSAPLAFAQAIRRAIPHVEMEAWVDAEMNRKMTPEEAAERERGAESIRLRIEAAIDHDPIKVLEANCWDLRCISSPIADTGDADIHWVVIEHHMAKRHEREVGRGSTPRQALADATKAEGRS